MKIIFHIFAVLFLLQSNALADFGFGQSASFNVNLLAASGSQNYASANSASFNVNLLGIRRAYADSDSSSNFDWFANTDPQPGTIGMCMPVASGSLRELYGNAWVDAFTTPSSGSNVIIINHGWNGSVEDRLLLAQAIHARVPQAYIYAWNWGASPENVVSPANPNGRSTEWDFAPLAGCTLWAPLCVAGASDTAIEIGRTLSHAHEQGRLLGDKLYLMGIRPDTHHIQMIGNSFGGVVAAVAAKTLYKKTNNTPITQLTTIDTPAMLFPYAIEAVDPASAERVEVIYYNWLMPFNFSRVAAGYSWGGTGGPRITTATNVLNLELNRDLWSSGLLHFRAVDWYTNSAAPTALDCESNPYGFGWSMAMRGSDTGWDAGLPKAWRLETETWGCSIDIVATAKTKVDKAVDEVKDSFESAASSVGKGASIVWDFANNNSALLLAGLPHPLSPMAAEKSSRYAVMAGETTADAAFVRTDVNIPPDAEQLVFDYRFGSVTPGDRIEVAINGQTELVIDGEVAGISQTYAMSTPIVVSQYAGQTITLQIALYPGGTEAAQAYITNLRLVAVTLAEDINGDKIISMADVLVLSQHWLEDGCNYSDHCSGADINGDDKVDFLDLARLASQWQ